MGFRTAFVPASDIYHLCVPFLLKLFALVLFQEVGQEAVPSLSWGSKALEDADCLDRTESTPYTQSTKDEGSR